MYIKIEKGNQILVKVGGGFISVKEFIEQYTQAEVEKIERKDVRSRVKDKLDILKISTNKSVTKSAKSDTNSRMSSQKRKSSKSSNSPMSSRGLGSPMRIVRFQDLKSQSQPMH